MRPAIIAAVLRRGNHVCAWCASKVDTGRKCDEGMACLLSACESDNMIVASCAACARVFSGYWHRDWKWSVVNAVRRLGPDNVVESAPFVDYLFAVTGDLAAFDNALARIEAQRNAPLGLVREKGRAA